MENLFRKTVAFTDAHFGRNGASPIALQDNTDFLQWAVDRALSWGAENCIFLGDWHDSRHNIRTTVLPHSLAGMELLNSSFKKTYWLSGNHDLPFREKRDGASIEFGRNLSNIEFIRDPLTTGNVTLLPWLVGDEYKSIKNINSRYVFGHLEMPGFLMNARIIMPDSPTLVKPDQFLNTEYVFSGHYHKRQKQGKVIYMGAIMPMNFSDSNDEDRGIMLLDWGKEPIFEAWPDQPLFKEAKLSELIDTPGIMHPKMTIRTTIDLPLIYEEAQEIRDSLVETYGLRKMELMKQPKDSAELQEFNDETVVFHTVDQMVIDGLMSIDGTGLSTDKLVAIYRQLTEI